MAFPEQGEPLTESGSDRGRVRDETLVSDDVEHGKPGHHRDRVAAERAEELRRRAQPVDVGPPSDHGGHRVPVAHGLAQGDEVRLESDRHERPEVLARASVAGLDLVGDDERPAARARRPTSAW